MLKAFVDAIAGLAVSSSEPKIIRDAGDPRKLFLSHNGTLTEVDVTPPLHASTVNTFEALSAAVERFGEDKQASIWHDRAQVIALLDDDDRRETVRLALIMSDQFKSLQKLPGVFDQRSLVLFLKRNLAGAVDVGLIAIFRQIDFSKREEGGATVKHGDESLGRSIHAAIANAADIPEYLSVRVPVYSNPGLVQFLVTIKLSVDIDVQRGTFELTPLPDELENAVRYTQEQLGELLRSGAPENATVFSGTPRFVSQDCDGCE
jgi:hypothetical protein